MDNVDRRDFLRGAAGAFAAASALAAPAGNEKVRVGLYGTRYSHLIGKIGIMKRASDTFEIAGAYEPEGTPPDNPAFNGIKIVSEDQLLGDPSIHLIIVEGQVDKTVPWARKAIAANKHVHLERPPGVEMEPFRQLVEEARRRKLLIQVGYPWKFSPGVVAAFEAVQKGYLGDVYMVRATVNTDIDARARAGMQRFKTGIFYDLGPYMVDLVVALLGKPKEVKGWFHHDDSGFPDNIIDNSLAVLEYPKAFAVVSCNARQAGSREQRQFEIIGTDGWANLQPVEPGRLHLHLREARGPYKAGPQEVALPVPPVPRWTGDLLEMARAIRTGTPLKYSYDHELLLQETVMRITGGRG
ncbi:MAG TPA: Gfo/Idh/MocA family oxidoreductase [Bryobacterales bacterium]|nr:Gfo/Idh/MocA family oxidoreductase [Bryobacterales bacterium]